MSARQPETIHIQTRRAIRESLTAERISGRHDYFRHEGNSEVFADDLAAVFGANGWRVTRARRSDS